MIREVEINGTAALVPLYRDEVETLIRALAKYDGPDKVAAMLAADQLSAALAELIRAHV